MALEDFKQIEKKWQKYWNENNIFKPEINPNKEGFYIQVAYPYPSGAMHIGHARTYTITDIVAKYHKIMGYNVLMPMGWHVSGTPVIASVEALKAGKKDIEDKFTNNFRIPKEDLKKLQTPQGFVNYMIDEAEYGYKRGFNILGLGIDWRRELTTVDPHYKEFIKWQYRKLNEKGYLVKGKYPIRFCPFHNDPVGDHDLVEGEGVGINEFSVLKFELEPGKFVVCATLRPETVFGQTNIWMNPLNSLEEWTNGKESWIASKEFFEKFKFQEKDLKKVSDINPITLIGKMLKAPGINREIPILPASFVKAEFGSGIVTSVPSDSPQDYIALMDLKEGRKKFDNITLDSAMLNSIEVIEIIKTQSLGTCAGKAAVDKFGIKNQDEEEKLEKAKDLAYLEGFYKGTMLDVAKEFKGLKVSVAKSQIRNYLEDQKKSFRYYELQGKVVCRCNTECVVSVLDNQWFVKYSDGKWKEESKETLKNMNIVPENLRTQYEKIFDWLEDKPCARTKGLGTSFEFQEGHIVEPLGDSTIYMAYFTISHLIKEFDVKKLNDSFFDYVFLSKGDSNTVARKLGVDSSLIKKYKDEFDYWYPLAFNTSAVELIPNHMSFAIFQHTAIFPKTKRQSGTLNLGMLILEGEKMSSSKGNVVLINDLVESIGADMIRLFLMTSVEPWEEMDWRQKEVESGISKIRNLLKFFENNCDSSLTGKIDSDKFSDNGKWLLSRFATRRREFLKAMESFELRKAVQQLTFEFFKDIKWYMQKIENKAEKEPVTLIANEWTRMISSFMPHTSEEIWQELLDNKKSVFISKNTFDFASIKDDNSEEMIKKTASDIRDILNITKIETLKKITIFSCADWKKDALKVFIENNKPRNKGLATKLLMENGFSNKGKEGVQVANSFASKPEEYFILDDFNILNSSKNFFMNEFNCEVEIVREDDSKNEKAKRALPSKPSLLVE